MKTNHEPTQILEILEDRIAPASAVYTDVDGDVIKVTASKGGTDAELQTIVDNGENMGQMETLALTSNFAGSNVKFSVMTRAAGGDGLVNVWHINANGFDLGAVEVAGDLAKLTVGDTIYSNGSVKSVKVQSIGVNGGAADKVWFMAGSTNSFSVAGDVNGAKLAWTIDTSEKLTVGSVTIGGNLTGGAADDSGSIRLTTGNGGTSELKSITVGGSLVATNYHHSGAIIVGDVSGNDMFSGIIGKASVGGNLKGFAGKDYNGTIYAATTIGMTTVGGSLIGGGEGSGSIFSGHLITGDVTVGGSLIGGAGVRSGSVFAFYGISKSVTIGQVADGNAGAYGGSVISPLGAIGNVKIGSYLSGGSGVYSGTVFGKTGVGSVWVGGSVFGGSNANAGFIGTDTANGTNYLAGDITIQGDLQGGSSSQTGTIYAGSAGNIHIAGSLIGGNTVSGTGSIYVLETVKSLYVGGDLQGDSKSFSGNIRVLGGTNDTAKLTSVTIGGSLVGDAGASGGAIQIDGSVDKFTIVGGIGGGTAANAGSLTFGTIKTLNIGTGAFIVGSIYGGSAAGAGTVTGTTLGTAVIGGDIVGGSASTTGAFIVGSATSISIGGDVLGGSSSNTGYVQITGSAGLKGKLTVGGDVTGSPDLNGTGFLQVSAGSANAIEIKGSLIGGAASMANRFNSGAVLVEGTLKSMTVGMDIKSGNFFDKSNFNLGAVRAGSIETMVVKGSLIGANTSSRVTIAGEGNSGNNMAIKSLTVMGSVSNAMILGGYDLSGTTVNGNGGANSGAQIGTVTINGDFFNGSIATGVSNNNANAQGSWADNNNVLLDAANPVVASIAKIVIKGNCFAATQSGISAELIKSITVGGFAVPIGAGAQFINPISGNFKAQQVVA